MNHLLCEGQIHGGVAQGAGQALMEAIVFDAAGQLVTGSFQDYAMPRAEDFPDLVSELTEVPATTNPLGVKGAGEAGATGAPPAIIGAILDALKAVRYRAHRHAGNTEPRLGGDQRTHQCQSSGVTDMTDAPNLFSDGKAYERLMGRWSRPAGEKFLDWVDPPKNLRWIDVGCGNGAFTEVLIARCSPLEVAGVDPSEGQLAYARTRPGTKMAQFKIADAQNLPFGDNSFDAASMALVITFIPDAVKAAREMARVVKPGGIVATYMWDFEGGGFPLAPVSIAMKSLGMATLAPPNVDASRRESMRAIWEKAGLQSIDTQVIRIRVAYSNFDDFWDSNSVRSARPAKRSRICRRRRASSSRRACANSYPSLSDGSIAYGAFANAVKGKVAA